MTGATQRAQERRRRGEARARIMAAASVALRERPYRELSVDELMASARLSRTIFYRHFDDLADLVLRLLDEAAAELYEHERALAEHAIDGPVAIRHALEAPVLAFAANGPLLRAVAEAASHDEQIERGFSALRKRFADLIETYLRDLVARGQTRIVEPAQTAIALNLLNEAYLLDVFGRPQAKVSVEIAHRTLAEIWAGAIFA